MKKFIVSFALLSFLFFANAQNDGFLKGKITDENGEAIFSASVVVDAAKGWAAATDFDGNYSITLPPGSYAVMVSYIGYENNIQRVEVKAGESTAFSLSLKPSEQVIGQVEVVSATKRGIVREKEVVTVETVSTELIENNNLTIASDVVDRVAGVTLLDGQVSIRGGSGYAYGTGSRVILVIDELPLLSPERNEILWDFVPMENLASMDVVKGASSVQYGSSALNGIVAVSTKWPKKKKETNISSFWTFYDNPPIREAKWWGFDQNFRERPNEMGVQFSHLRKLNKEMDLVVSGALIGNQTHIESQYNNRVRNNIKFRFRPEKVKGLMFSINSNMLYRNNGQFFIWENEEEGAYQGRSFEDKYFRWSIDPIVKYYFKENNQLSFINRIYYDQRLGSNYRGQYNAIKTYQDFQYKRTFSNTNKEINASVSTGIINMMDRIQARSFRSFSRNGEGTFIFNTASAYFQSDFGWRDLTLAFGGRFDYVSLDGNRTASKPVFNAGISYEVMNKNFLRFGFGQSFRIPSVAERFVREEITEALGQPILALPNPDIRPESGYSFELGYKKIIKGQNFELNIDASTFYQLFDDMTEFTFGSYQDPLDTTQIDLGFKMLNVAKARIFGWELSVNGTNKIKKSTLTYQIGYTYNYAANAAENPDLLKFKNVLKGAFQAFAISDEEYSDYYDNNQRNILHGILRYRFRHTLKFDFNYQYDKFSIGTNIRYYSYMDRVDNVFAFAIPGISDYRDALNNKGEVIVDLRTSYQFSEQFKLALIIKNIANNDYQLRPAKPDAPRTFAIQGNLTF